MPEPVYQQTHLIRHFKKMQIKAEINSRRSLPCCMCAGCRNAFPSACCRTQQLGRLHPALPGHLWAPHASPEASAVAFSVPSLRRQCYVEELLHVENPDLPPCMGRRCLGAWHGWRGLRPGPRCGHSWPDTRAWQPHPSLWG